MGEVDTALFSFTHHVPITACNRTIHVLILFYELRVVHKLCDHFWGSIGHSDYFNIEMAAA